MKRKRKKLIFLILFITILTTAVGCKTVPVVDETSSYIVQELELPSAPVLVLIPNNATDSEVLSINNKNLIKLTSYISKLETFVENQRTYYQDIITAITD